MQRFRTCALPAIRLTSAWGDPDSCGSVAPLGKTTGGVIPIEEGSPWHLLKR